MYKFNEIRIRDDYHICKDDWICKNNKKEKILVVGEVQSGKTSKIIKEIEYNNYFQDMITDYLKYEITVPQDKKFTCSIGIASTDWNQGCNIYNAITRADEVLYSIKNTTKNNYGIYK